MMKKEGFLRNGDTPKAVLETMYLAVLGLYFIRLFFDTTLFQLSWPEDFYPFMRGMAVCIAAIHVLLSMKERWKSVLMGLFMTGVFMLSFRSTGYGFLIDIPLLMMGAINVPYKKILRTYFWCGTVIMGFAMVGALTGCVRDLIYMEDGFYKHSFGICYPTDFAAHVVYLLLVFWVAYKAVHPTIVGGLMCLFVAFQLKFCGTKCSEIVTVLAIGGVFYDWLVSSSDVVGRKFSVGMGIKRFLGLFERFLTVLMAVCAGVMISLSLWYDKTIPLFAKINAALSGRLKLAQNAMETYGIKLFGTAFRMVGNGSDTVGRVDYNFVDSSYCLVLVRYGFAVLVVLFLIYFLTTQTALEHGKRRLVLAFALVSIHCMIEHHLTELAYNPLLLLPFADMSCVEEKPDGKEGSFKEGKIKTYVGYAMAGGVICLSSPWILAYGKTLVTLLRLNEQGRRIYFIIALSILSVAVFVFFKEVVGLFVLKLEKRPEKTNISGMRWLLLGICSVVMLASFGVSEKVIRSRQALYQDALDASRPVIANLCKELEDDCKIYVEHVPVVYKRNIGSISYRIMPAGTPMTDDDVIIITKKDQELYRLIDAGYEFGELSEQDGIYSNCKDAIQLLEESGIEMQACYSVENKVDLQEMAKANGLKLSDDGGLVIEGAKKSLIHGPWVTIYGGMLRVEYRLKLLDNSAGRDLLAKVRLSSDSGKRIYKEQKIKKNDFDEYGNYTVVLERDINSSQKVEFLLFAYGDTVMEIEEITYKKVESN